MTAEASTGSALWCTTCQAHHVARQWPMSGVVLYRCGTCGHWVRCRACMAVRSAQHTCKPEGE